MPALYVNTGAPRNLGREDWVFRDFRWIRDTQALQGDVYPATPDEARRFRHKLHAVEEMAYPSIPGTGKGTRAAGTAGTAGEVEDADPSGGQSTAVSDDAEPAPSPDVAADVVDIELYRVGESNWYELPNGDKVQGRDNALRALGVEVADGG